MKTCALGRATATAALMFLFLGSASTQARPVNTLRVDRVAHGVKLALILGKRTYPWNALVKVGVRLRNESNRTVWVRTVGNSEPGIVEPQPEVHDRQGRLLFPPAFPYLYPLPGPLPVPLALAPHQVMTRADYIILRAPYLRLVAHIGLNRRFNATTFVVATKSITLHLTSLPGPAYQVEFHRPPDRLSATVTAVTAKPHGRLLHIEYSDCDGTANWTFITWAPGGNRFVPDCPQPHEWHVIAGYLNQPVIAIDYTAPTARA
jgi:hypothetical protein